MGKIYHFKEWSGVKEKGMRIVWSYRGTGLVQAFVFTFSLFFLPFLFLFVLFFLLFFLLFFSFSSSSLSINLSAFSLRCREKQLFMSTQTFAQRVHKVFDRWEFVKCSFIPPACGLSYTQTQHTHTHTLSLYLTDRLPYTLFSPHTSLSLSLSISLLSLSHALSLTSSLSLSHTHTHTLPIAL